MRRNELRAYMAKYGDTNETLAQALGRSYVAFSQKINGKKPFTQTEIKIILERYHLEADDVQRIFFT